MKKPSRISMGACYSGHYWTREPLWLGYDVFLISVQYVILILRVNKNDCKGTLVIAEASETF